MYFIYYNIMSYLFQKLIKKVDKYVIYNFISKYHQLDYIHMIDLNFHYDIIKKTNSF